MEKLQLLAMVQAYTGIGVGLMIGLGAAGACIGVGIMCSRFLEAAARQAVEEIRGARERAAAIVAQAEKRITQMIEEAKTAAKEEGNREKAAAKAEIAQELSRAREQLRDHVASLAVAGAEKILRREVDAKAHAALLDAIRQQL